VGRSRRRSRPRSLPRPDPLSAQDEDPTRSDKPLGFRPQPPSTTGATLGLGPLEASGGLLGPSPGDPHTGSGYFGSLTLDLKTQESNKFYAAWTLAASYLNPTGRVFVSNPGGWNENVETASTLTGSEPLTPPQPESMKLLYAGTQLSLGRAFRVVQPFYIAGAVNAGVDTFTNLGETRMGRYPVPSIQADETLALGFAPNRGRYGLAVSGGVAQDFLTVRSNAAGAALDFDGKDPVGTFVQPVRNAPHVGFNTWTRLDGGMMVEGSGRIMRTDNTTEHRYAARLAGPAAGLPTALSAEYRNGSGRGIADERHVAGGGAGILQEGLP